MLVLVSSLYLTVATSVLLCWEGRQGAEGHLLTGGPEDRGHSPATNAAVLSCLARSVLSSPGPELLPEPETSRGWTEPEPGLAILIYRHI